MTQNLRLGAQGKPDDVLIYAAALFGRCCAPQLQVRRKHFDEVHEMLAQVDAAAHADTN